MNEINEIIFNIKSNYKIKKYIHNSWFEILENIINNDIKISKINKILQPNESIIDLLQKKYNINNIDELDYLMVKKKHLNKEINCDQIYNSLDDEIKIDILKKIYSNNFIPLKIVKWIECYANNYIQIKFANITINILDDKNIDSELINHIIIIIRWLFAINSSPYIELNIYIFLSPEEKILNDFCLHSLNTDKNDKCYLSRTNVNSGASLYNSWIQIFRREEILKVLIHELIHYLELDINVYANIIDEKCSHINIHSKSNNILVNEAYTEFLAIYLHTMYITKIKYPYSFQNEFWKLYILEEKYTIYQINKIFKNYSIPNLEYFRNPNNFIQYTNVISYYILKYLFLINTKYFIITHNSKKNTIKLVLYLLPKFYKLKIPKNNNIIDKSLKMSINKI